MIKLSNPFKKLIGK